MQLQRLSVSTPFHQLFRLRIGLQGSRLSLLCAILRYGGSICAVSWLCTNFLHPGYASLVSDGPSRICFRLPSNLHPREWNM